MVVSPIAIVFFRGQENKTAIHMAQRPQLINEIFEVALFQLKQKITKGAELNVLFGCCKANDRQSEKESQFATNTTMFTNDQHYLCFSSPGLHLLSDSLIMGFASFSEDHVHPMQCFRIVSTANRSDVQKCNWNIKLRCLYTVFLQCVLCSFPLQAIYLSRSRDNYRHLKCLINYTQELNAQQRPYEG